jgi:hypothetical protein
MSRRNKEGKKNSLSHLVKKFVPFEAFICGHLTFSLTFLLYDYLRFSLVRGLLRHGRIIMPLFLGGIGKFSLVPLVMARCTLRYDVQISILLLLLMSFAMAYEI